VWGKLTLSGAITSALCIGSLAAGEARLAYVFQDNMVLQRDVPVPVWGRADPGTTVDVAFAGQQAEAKADTSGYWKLVLDPMEVSKSGWSQGNQT
jgi:sialate O-acetylesterase